MHVTDLQRLMARTWPGLEHERLGQWDLRAADGFTSRANSTLPLGDPGVDLAIALAHVIDWYRSRGLVPRLQLPALPDGAPGPADEVAALCDQQNWTSEPWTLVMVREPHWTGEPRGLDLTWSEAPDDQWLDLYHYRGSTLPRTARSVIMAAPAWYLKASRDGRLVGIGRAAVAGEVVTLTAIEVVGDQRRRGLGAAITEALAGRGAFEGVRLSALQVFAHNDEAVRLYRRLGYVVHHRYRYRCPAES